MDWYKLVWKRYADFEGRSRRKEYWMFTLYNTLIVVALELVMFLLKAHFGLLVGAILMIYSLAALIPSLAVGIRRLHDTGKSGWWLLIGLIPLLGAIVLLVFLASDSAAEANEYGQNPKLMAQPA